MVRESNAVGRDQLSGGAFRLGEWLVEPRLNRLTRDGESFQIELKMMDVLVCLSGHAGDLVERQQLIDTVWATEYITEKTLTRAVAELRRTLGDDAKEPTYIETIHRKGYRLIAQVEPIERPTATVTPFPTPSDARSPYPGLAAFTEEDAEFFFGRETEVNQLWRKITGRKLMAVIGPSGVGKSSFLRAGVIASAPEEWSTRVMTPGESPLTSLARGLVAEFKGDVEAIESLVGLSDANRAVAIVSRWRDRHERALLIVDQFEELFTLNPEPVQHDFSTLLRRLVDAAGIHVVLAMRDDFLYRCQAFQALTPVFDALTPVKPPARDALHRALVEPARKLGFAFEDGLASEMVAEVEDERGALPMLAFAVARLWDRRDRDRRQLTRRAFEEIGGVAGALARHAEETIDHVGADRIPIVREIFRNLVTAEGTRAVREWDEVLSVFREAQRESAGAVLAQLVDARLLTSYEVTGEDRGPTRMVEVVHESLLANWPRLVRWQTQDADAVQLRDQLRQAAKTWADHDRARDYLWTGKAYREFEVWRENYPGGLTELEEEFAHAMIAHAKTRRRRRRIAATVSFLALLIVLGLVTSSWQRSVREARRAEAAHLVSLGQLELESNPSSTVAHAIASLEVSDSREARLLALDALWRGPTGFVASDDEDVTEITFTPDGQWLVYPTDRMHVIGAEGSHDELGEVNGGGIVLATGTEPGLVVTYPPYGGPEPLALWSAAEERLVATTDVELPANFRHIAFDLGRRRALLVLAEDDRLVVEARGFDGTTKRLGTLPFEPGSARMCTNFPSGRWTAVSNGREVFVVDIGDDEISEPRRIDTIDGPITGLKCDSSGRFIVTHSPNGQIRFWGIPNGSLLHTIQAPLHITGWNISAEGTLFEAWRFDRATREVETWIWSLGGEEPSLLRHVNLGRNGGVGPAWVLDPVAHLIVSALNPDSKLRLWSLDAPADAEPVATQLGGTGAIRRITSHPAGRWVATCGSEGVVVWPVARPYPVVIDRYQERVGDLVFGPEGAWLATSSYEGHGTVRAWGLEAVPLPPSRILFQAGNSAWGLAASPDGTQILVGTRGKGASLLSIAGDAERPLPNTPDVVGRAAFSPDGRFAAVSGKYWGSQPQPRAIQVWDLQSFEPVSEIDLGTDEFVSRLHFTRDGSLLSGSMAGLLIWDVSTGTNEVLAEGPVDWFAVSSDERRVVFSKVDEFGTVITFGRAHLLDMETGSTTPLTTHGDRVVAVAMDGAGTMVVTGDEAGVIRVGPITGEEPQLLLGHDHEVWAVAIDPQGRWIASASGTEVRLWPIPDLSKTPLHALPRAELIAKLKTLTNLRVVRDQNSPTGWKLTHDPFPGWKTVATW